MRRRDAAWTIQREMDEKIVRTSSLFLGGFNSLAVLASNDLNLLSLDHLAGLHLERGILDDERPDIIT